MRDLFEQHNEDLENDFDFRDPPMTLEEYASHAMDTAIYPGALVYPVLGLVGEAGEVSEKLKKFFRDGEYDHTALEDPMLEIPHRIRDAMARELGDCLWYITAAAADLGYSLEEIAELNLEKLEERAMKGTLQGSGDYR
jgi:NTP pyrophosphatase (non-canonical NTP hydrolase)